MHLAYIWIVSHLSTKNYRNWWKFDEVLTKTNLLSFFLGHGVLYASFFQVILCDGISSVSLSERRSCYCYFIIIMVHTVQYGVVHWLRCRDS